MKTYKLLGLILPLLLFAQNSILDENVEVFAEELEKDPENRYAILRLADSYKNLKEYQKAIDWYKVRLEKGLNKDHLWACKFSLGECYQELNLWHESLYWYLEAYQTDTGRLDPLLKIASYYREHEENDLAYIFAKHGARYFPSYDYHFDQELSIVSFYTRYKEDGYQATSDLLIRKDVPKELKNHSYNNLLFYVENLKNVFYKPIEIDLPLVVEGADECYHPTNPSICRTENGYKVICRSVNYTQTGAKYYRTNDPQGYYLTKNFLLDYDVNFKLLGKQEIVENLVRQKYTHGSVHGLEDCRLFSFNREWWFGCTTLDTNPDWVPQISLCKLADRGTDQSIQVEQLYPISGPIRYRCEKNWLPFVHDDKLHVVYSYDPFLIFSTNLRMGSVDTVVQYSPTYDFSQFRGSAGPIPFDDGFLILIHEVVPRPDQTRVYVHRFLFMDKYFMIKKISKPFIFLGQGVEFCCGMTLDHSGENLVMTIGIEDNKAYLAFSDINNIRSYLGVLKSNF